MKFYLILFLFVISIQIYSAQDQPGEQGQPPAANQQDAQGNRQSQNRFRTDQIRPGADDNAKPKKHRNYAVKYYKEWQQKDNRTDEFTQELKPNEITQNMHFRVTRDKQGKILNVAYYYKKLKIAPYVSDDDTWFHFIKYYYDKKNRLNKKIFYRVTGQPQAQYKFEWNDQGKIIKVEFMKYNLKPYREKPYTTQYFLLFDYYPDGKLRKSGRYSANANPHEKFIYDTNERLIRYERFYANSDTLYYYITYQYDNQGKVSTKIVYNIDGVMVEVPSTEQRRKYKDLLRTRYPRSGRRGPVVDENEQMQ